MPTAEYVRSILDYDPETGILTWKPRADRSKSWNTRFAGTRAGWEYDEKGILYRRISLDGKTYREARLIYLWMTGNWPTEEIDHADVDGTNNKWANIRPATRSQNGCNRGRHSNNKVQFKGVTQKGNRFRARIKVNKQEIHLGMFDTAPLAHQAYCEAARVHHKEFAHG